MGRQRDGPGRMGQGAAGRGRAGRSAHAARQGTAGAGPGGKRCWVGRGGADGRCARPGGARPRQAGPTANARCGAGPGRGRHEAAEGLERPGVGEGRRGETGLAHVAGLAGRCALWGRAGSGGRRTAEARRGRVGVGRGQSRGSRRMGSGEPGWPVSGEEAAGHRRVGRVGKNEKTGGIHKLGAYVPRPV
jgi:hypothetical protein